MNDLTSHAWPLSVATATAWICASAISLPCAAQDEGPIIVGQKHEWDGLVFRPVNMILELEFRHEQDQAREQGQPTRRDADDRFTQALTLSTGGYYGHANFIDFNLTGTFGVTQEWIDSDSSDRHGMELDALIEYNANVLILAQSNAPTTIYSQRSQTFIDRPFGDSVESTVMESGIRALLRIPSAPTSLHYFHRDETQHASIDSSDFDLSQDTFEWQTQWRIEPHQELTWESTFDIVRQSGNLFNANSFERFNGLATHVLDFGSDYEHTLRSTLMTYFETGKFPLNRVRLDESLRLRHTPRFETRYDYSFDWQERPDLTQLLHRGSIGFQHRLFESLVTSATAGASLLEITPGDFTSQQVFGNLNFDYHKRVPLGRLSSGLFLNVVQEDDSGEGASIQVNDEVQVFGPSGLVLLTRRNVDPASIVVTDSTGLIVYTQGIDYTVNVFGDQVEIRTIPGGGIGLNQVVLVDYLVLPEPPNTTTTVGVGTSVRYDFEESFLRGLGVYVRYFRQEQSRSVDAPLALIDDNIQDIAFGADYRLGNLTLAAEHEIRDSTLSPYTANRASAVYLQPLGRGSVLSFNVTYDDIDRTNDDVKTSIFTAGGRWSQLFTERLSMNLAVLWRNQDDTLSGNLQGWEQQLDLTWRYRQTTVFGSFRNSMLDGEVSDSHFITFLIGLRREF